VRGLRGLRAGLSGDGDLPRRRTCRLSGRTTLRSTRSSSTMTSRGSGPPRRRRTGRSGRQGPPLRGELPGRKAARLLDGPGLLLRSIAFALFASG
jgi:hypothetical protein